MNHFPRPAGAPFWRHASHLFTLVLGLAMACRVVAAADAKPIRVLIWDERQPAQQAAYPNFLGNAIAGSLRAAGGLTVTSAGLDEPKHGLGTLDEADVLLWWGHQRHGEITDAEAKSIVRKIKAGRLSLIVLHSAHWSQPFVEAMRERSRADALAALAPPERATARVLERNLFDNFRTPPKYSSLLTPCSIYRKPISGPDEVNLILPNCCFPAYRGDGKPSQMRILLPDHPIARGLPATFTIDQTEMYDEPFHVPPPDQVVLEERWATGEWFRSGCVWKIGQGRVFYFRPGHEIYGVYKNPNVLKVIENAVRWLGTREEPAN
jgi:trehalose utilization protein